MSSKRKKKIRTGKRIKNRIQKKYKIVWYIFFAVCGSNIYSKEKKIISSIESRIDDTYFFLFYFFVLEPKSTI
jgi:predicted  nucleic acid-binding Zn ribbon protein